MASLEDNVPIELRETWQKLVEALRFSDPVSAPELAELESRLNFTAGQLTMALKSQSGSEFKEAAQNFWAILKERNIKCKLLK